ncbi:AAA family ATPase [Enterobacillus tribolii]|uniref:Putative kinase n=1 Tax=Enterobacillus tribolii TaxID=1487935 RepID=A0A370R2B8_9GAMM|nr:AAA family ATPase [Enterobacillus tribolii]MBW7983661.1 HD domain-containing protein [Enterobacillus tribolii]RDK96589.1 putative kinase [Enterobacillus tribolii]
MSWQLTTDKAWNALETRFPWVADMRHVPQDRRHHAEGDVATHTRMVLEELAKLPGVQALTEEQREIVWAAALLHDVEKRSTTQTDDAGNITSPGHARMGELTARRLLYRDIPTPFHIREQVAALVRLHGLPMWLLERPSPERQVLAAALRVDLRLLAILAEADLRGRQCEDQAGLLERLELFGLFCQEQMCWGQARAFTSAAARYHYLTHPESPPEYEPWPVPGSGVTLLSALPGMGKDRYVAQHCQGMAVVSLDDIRRRHRIDPKDSNANGWVVQQAKEQARVLLRRGEPFVWNATNLTRQLRAQLIQLFTDYHATVRIVYLEVPYAQWRAQNQQREYAVPDAVMDRMLRKLEVPQRDEAHCVEYFVS